MPPKQILDKPMPTPKGGYSGGPLPAMTPGTGSPFPAMTPGSLGGAPIAPQQQAPLPTIETVNPGSVSVGQFTDKAPTPTPYGDFTAPDPSKVADDPYYQFRAKEGQKALERSAAARGTLLSGGTLKALEGYSQGLASEEAGKSFDRALAGYTTNRDTNAQNFGQAMGAFQGNLGAFNANTGATLGAFNANTAATLGAGRLNADTAFGSYDRANDAAGADQAQQQGVLDSQYAQQVAQAREQAAQAAASTNAVAQGTSLRSPFPLRRPMR